MEFYILAIIAALFWSFNDITIKMGMVKGKPLIGVFIALLSGTPLLFVITIVTQSLPDIFSMSFTTILFLGLAGFFRMILGRVFFYTGAKMIGVSRTSPLASTNLVFSVLLGIVILKENINIFIVIGIVVVFLGVLLISLSEPKLPDQKNKIKSNFTKGILFGICAGFSWGIAPVFIRIGILESKSAISATFVSELIGFIIMFLILISGNQIKNIRYVDKKSSHYMLLAGIINTIAVLIYFNALKIAPVVLVMPVISITPLFTIILSKILIHKMERINFKNVLGSILIVLGVYLVIFSYYNV